MLNINKNLKIDFIQTKPFYIFKIDNFLPDELYRNLSKEFNNIISEEIENLSGHNNKYSFNSSHKNYYNFISKQKSMELLQKNIFDNSFIETLYKKLFFQLISSRSSDFKYLLKFFRLKRFNSENRNFFDKFFFTDINLSVEYSMIRNGSGKIVPHTDARSKLLSLMLYFPDKTLSENQKNKIGTTFYISKKKNIENRHLDDVKEQEKLIEGCEKKFVLPFIEKNLYGFIRNPYSWHSVEPFEIDNNFIRKSININFYF